MRVSEGRSTLKKGDSATARMRVPLEVSGVAIANDPPRNGGGGGGVTAAIAAAAAAASLSKR